MSSTSLPAEAEWPDYLFRVTSSLTWRRTVSPFSFISPVQQLYPAELTLIDAFPTHVAFKDAVARHLKTSHIIESGLAFRTPFISTTTSLRYALSVAELHHQRDGKEVTIAVIDTTLIQERRPIWDAAAIADLINLDCSKGDFKDEFLVFGSIKASQESLKVARYHDLVYRIGGLLPAFLEKDSSKRARFSTFWRGIPKRTTRFTPFEASSAFQIAQSMTTARLMIPLMVMVLFLEERVNYGTPCIDEVVELVSSRIRLEDIDAYFRFVLNASYGEPTADTTNDSITVYDFLDTEYCPRQASASTEVKYVNKCLVSLRRKLHENQAVKIKNRFNLTATALVVRQFTRLDADKIIKTCDRGSSDFGNAILQSTGGPDLALAFMKLKNEVEDCTVSPLSRLNGLLKTVKRDAPQEEVRLLRRKHECVLILGDIDRRVLDTTFYRFLQQAQEKPAGGTPGHCGAGYEEVDC